MISLSPVSIESIPPVGIASRALIARLRTNLLDLAWVSHDHRQVGCEADDEFDLLADRAAQNAAPCE